MFQTLQVILDCLTVNCESQCVLCAVYYKVVDNFATCRKETARNNYRAHWSVHTHNYSQVASYEVDMVVVPVILVRGKTDCTPRGKYESSM